VGEIVPPGWVLDPPIVGVSGPIGVTVVPGPAGEVGVPEAVALESVQSLD